MCAKKVKRRKLKRNQAKKSQKINKDFAVLGKDQKKVVNKPEPKKDSKELESTIKATRSDLETSADLKTSEPGLKVSESDIEALESDVGQTDLDLEVSEHSEVEQIELAPKEKEAKKEEMKPTAAKPIAEPAGSIALDTPAAEEKSIQSEEQLDFEPIIVSMVPEKLETSETLEKLETPEKPEISGASKKTEEATEKTPKQITDKLTNKPTTESTTVKSEKIRAKLENISHGQAYSDQRSVMKDAEIAAQEKHKRHKLYPVIWWLIGGIVVAVLVFCIVMLVVKMTSGQSNEQSDTQEPDTSQEELNKTEQSDDLQEGDTPEQKDPGESDSEQHPAEKPAEPEQPSTPAPEPTPEEPTTPIEPRPEVPANPQVPAGNKVIALTFDDGPSAVTTPRLLDILQGRNTKATFFVLGSMAERVPDLVRREIAEGHVVGSHTYNHAQLTTLNPTQIRNEIVRMDEVFKNILGQVPPFTRPPYGAYDQIVQNNVGQPLILWSIDPKDWQDRDANIVCSRVVSAAFDGAIILVHDIHSTTVDAVPCIIDTLRSQGYQFLTIPELAAVRDVPLVNGWTYFSF